MVCRNRGYQAIKIKMILNTHKKYSFILLLLIISTTAVAGESERFPLGYSSHFLIKQKIISGNETLQNDLIQLVADANKILELHPPSVMDNMSAPDGVDPHDYVSYAPYWWPDPKKEDGLPYIHRDGHINTILRSQGDDQLSTIKKSLESPDSVHVGIQ